MKTGATTGDLDGLVAKANALGAGAQDLAAGTVYTTALLGIPSEGVAWPQDSPGARLWRWLVRR